MRRLQCALFRISAPQFYDGTFDFINRFAKLRIYFLIRSNQVKST